jgi:hypothetical protein
MIVAMLLTAISLNAQTSLLPDEPGLSDSLQVAGQNPANPSEGSAVLLGTVFDPNGGVIEGAQLTLMAVPGMQQSTTKSGVNGEFSFAGLAAGTFRLTVRADGMTPFMQPDIHIQAGQTLELPRISLTVATANAEVQVTAGSEEIAQEQITLQLEQRVFGVFPNFYTSYLWDAQRIGSRQKFRLAIRSITDPVAFIGFGLTAGLQQAADTFPGYHQGAEGYGKRYGADFANDAIGRLLGSAVFPSLLRQDPRYFYRGSGTKKSRALYAVSRGFLCRGDNGKTQFAYSYILGAFGAAGLSNLYHPASDRGLSLTLYNGLLGTAGHSANNLVREFLFKRLTPKVPAYGTGKP